MPKIEPRVLIEDDPEDKEIFEEVMKLIGMPNPLVWLQNAAEAHEYLKTTTDKPFLIVSDINLPGQSGIQFKKQIDGEEELRKKSIPFIFYSTTSNQKTINEAYADMTVQGFYQKGNNLAEIKEQLQIIFQYWQSCKHPNFFINQAPKTS